MVCQSKPYKVQQIQENSDEGDQQIAYKFDEITFKLDKVEKCCEHLNTSAQQTNNKSKPKLSTQEADKQESTKYETNVKVKIGNQKVKVQVDSGADINVMDINTYKALQKPPRIKPTQAKLKPFNSKPIPTKGYIWIRVATSKHQVLTKFYITETEKSVPILGKYTAFDLDILQIKLQQREQADKYDGSKYQTNSSKHLTYEEMSKQLTPLATTAAYVEKLHAEHQPISVTDTILKKHGKVFKGIGKHKFRQVQLNIDKEVPPKIQPQRRIPFPKREQFEKILDELESEGIIEPVEGPTE